MRKKESQLVMTGSIVPFTNAVDYKKARKAYRKLKVPKEYYDPCAVPWEASSWFGFLSERSIGKTTNILLFGLILNKLYGTQVQYIRETPEMLAPKNMANLCSVIQNCGYIQDLTDGEYNGIEYHARKWRYTYYDPELGKITARSDVVISCLAVTESGIYKSSYNAPNGDFIIFDECISRYNYHNEFVDFCDLTKTIGRDRDSIKIILLANTIDPYAPIFEEIEGQNIIETMEIGTHEQYLTHGGTPVYLELCGNQNPERARINSLFYGFKNPKLRSITGGGWAMNNYPHNYFRDYETVDRSHFIRCSNNILVQLELCKADEIGFFVNVHKATRFKDTDIIWTTGTINTAQERFKYGYTPLDKLLLELKNKNRWYYSSNMIGTLVATYFRMADTIK